MNKKRLKDRRVQKTGTSYQDRIILETPPTGLAADFPPGHVAEPPPVHPADPPPDHIADPPPSPGPA